MKSILSLVLAFFSIQSFAACLTPAELQTLLSTKFDEGQEIIRRSKLEGITWSLASFYKSKPEATVQYGSRCGTEPAFYQTLTSTVVGDQLQVVLDNPASPSDIKWAFYGDDIMMELVKYTHSGLPSRGVRCKIVDSVTAKEKIICRNSAGAGKVAYSCFVKNLAVEANFCLVP